MQYFYLKNDFVERAVFLKARNANKPWRVFKEHIKVRAFIFKNTPTSVFLFLKKLPSFKNKRICDFPELKVAKNYSLLCGVYFR